MSPALESETTDRLVERLGGLLPGLIVECIFEFGSTTRGEAAGSSDVDLWVLVSSPEKVYIDKALATTKYGPRLPEYLEGDARQVMENDTWQVIARQLELPADTHLSCPIADTRWFLWELACETSLDPFVFSTYSRPHFDPGGFMARLLDCFWRTLPFHVHPEHGMICLLRMASVAQKDKLIQKIETGEVTWYRQAVDVVRSPVFVLTLVRDGKPLYMRQDVMDLIDAEFPAHTEAAQQAYSLKCSDDGRIRAGEMVADGDRADARALAMCLLQLWSAVSLQLDEVVLSGCSRLPLLESGWREANWAAYSALLAP